MLSLFVLVLTLYVDGMTKEGDGQQGKVVKGWRTSTRPSSWTSEVRLISPAHFLAEPAQRIYGLKTQARLKRSRSHWHVYNGAIIHWPIMEGLFCKTACFMGGNVRTTTFKQRSNNSILLQRSPNNVPTTFQQRSSNVPTPQIVAL